MSLTIDRQRVQLYEGLSGNRCVSRPHLARHRELILAGGVRSHRGDGGTCHRSSTGWSVTDKHSPRDMNLLPIFPTEPGHTTRERQRRNVQKKNITCRKRKVFEGLLYPKFQGRIDLFSVKWITRIQGFFLALKESIKGHKMDKTRETEHEWAAMTLVPFRHSVWLHVVGLTFPSLQLQVGSKAGLQGATKVLQCAIFFERAYLSWVHVLIDWFIKLSYTKKSCINISHK